MGSSPFYTFDQTWNVEAKLKSFYGYLINANSLIPFGVINKSVYLVTKNARLKFFRGDDGACVVSSFRHEIVFP